MNASTAPVEPAVRGGAGERTVGLREVNQRAGQIYREVESTGVPVTVTDHGRPIAQIIPIRRDETPFERLVRLGQVRRAERPFRMPTERYVLPEGVDLEEFLLGEREEER